MHAMLDPLLTNLAPLKHRPATAVVARGGDVDFGSNKKETNDVAVGGGGIDGDGTASLGADNDKTSAPSVSSSFGDAGCVASSSTSSTSSHSSSYGSSSLARLPSQVGLFADDSAADLSPAVTVGARTPMAAAMTATATGSRNSEAQYVQSATASSIRDSSALLVYQQYPHQLKQHDQHQGQPHATTTMAPMMNQARGAVGAFVDQLPHPHPHPAPRRPRRRRFTSFDVTPRPSHTYAHACAARTHRQATFRLSLEVRPWRGWGRYGRQEDGGQCVVAWRAGLILGVFAVCTRVRFCEWAAM